MKDPYPSTVPSKYDPDGNAQTYVGNSIICPLAPSSPLHESLRVLREKLRCSGLSYLVARDALLEPRQWHTTVFICARDKIRGEGYWPKGISTRISQEEVLSIITDRLRDFDLQGALPCRMVVNDLRRTKYSINVHLLPESTEEDARLSDLRDRLSELLGIRHPEHASFTFHVTVAYLLRWLDEKQEKELDAILREHLRGMPRCVDMERPTFCKFQDMKSWSPVLELKNL